MQKKNNINNNGLSIEEIVGIVAASVIVCLIVFLASFYLIYKIRNTSITTLKNKIFGEGLNDGYSEIYAGSVNSSVPKYGLLESEVFENSTDETNKGASDENK